MQKNVDFYFEKQDDSSKLIYTIGLLWGQISNKLDSLLSKYNLNISKFNILMIIKHIGGKDGIQQNEISQRLLVTPSNITKLLDRLEKDKMISRNPKENDRRVKLIKISDTASSLLDEIWPYYSAEVIKITEKLAENDKQDIQKILVEWLTNIK